jgi:hypothetical protein
MFLAFSNLSLNIRELINREFSGGKTTLGVSTKKPKEMGFLKRTLHS